MSLLPGLLGLRQCMLANQSANALPGHSRSPINVHCHFLFPFCLIRVNHSRSTKYWQERGSAIFLPLMRRPKSACSRRGAVFSGLCPSTQPISGDTVPETRRVTQVKVAVEPKERSLLVKGPPGGPGMLFPALCRMNLCTLGEFRTLGHNPSGETVCPLSPSLLRVNCTYQSATIITNPHHCPAPRDCRVPSKCRSHGKLCPSPALSSQTCLVSLSLDSSTSEGQKQPQFPRTMVS